MLCVSVTAIAQHTGKAAPPSARNAAVTSQHNLSYVATGSIRDSSSYRNDKMLPYYKTNQAWVNLTTQIDTQLGIFKKLQSQRSAISSAARAKRNAKQNTSGEENSLKMLNNSIKPVADALVDMDKKRRSVEAQVNMRRVLKENNHSD